MVPPALRARMDQDQAAAKDVVSGFMAAMLADDQDRQAELVMAALAAGPVWAMTTSTLLRILAGSIRDPDGLLATPVESHTCEQQTTCDLGTELLRMYLRGERTGDVADQVVAFMSQVPNQDPLGELLTWVVVQMSSAVSSGAAGQEESG